MPGIVGRRKQEETGGKMGRIEIYPSLSTFGLIFYGGFAHLLLCGSFIGYGMLTVKGVREARHWLAQSKVRQHSRARDEA
jgi:hypothetical protein